jgi:hypothetical protein
LTGGIGAGQGLSACAAAVATHRPPIRAIPVAALAPRNSRRFSSLAISTPFQEKMPVSDSKTHTTNESFSDPSRDPSQNGHCEVNKAIVDTNKGKLAALIQQLKGLPAETIQIILGKVQK